MEITEPSNRSLRLALVPLRQYPAPASTRPIPERQLLGGCQISPEACCLPRLQHDQPFGMTVVTAALEILRLQQPQQQWLLAEMDLVNPRTGPQDAAFRIRLRQRPGKRPASLLIERNEICIGSLHFSPTRKNNVA
ncbi:MAG: hypothetical protein ACKOZT_05875 [Cyanobium sp.]